MQTHEVELTEDGLWLNAEAGDRVVTVLDEQGGIEYNRNHLSAERRRKLDALGFVWNCHANSWEKNLRELVKFRKRFGHCRVPGGWAENRSLGNWVKHQRDRSHSLSSEQTARLNALGFVWNAQQRARP